MWGMWMTPERTRVRRGGILGTETRVSLSRGELPEGFAAARRVVELAPKGPRKSPRSQYNRVVCSRSATLHDPRRTTRFLYGEYDAERIPGKQRISANRRPAAGHSATRIGPRCRHEGADLARRYRIWEDPYYGSCYRGGWQSGARNRAQQDARRAASQRVRRVLPQQRRRVLRQLLRLLPARGLRPAHGHLYREGRPDQRGHR